MDLIELDFARSGECSPDGGSRRSDITTALSKRGNRCVGKEMCLSPVVAPRHNQIIKAFAQWLQINGKTPMHIVSAAMRKLLHQAFGDLKHRCPFNPNLAFTLTFKTVSKAVEPLLIVVILVQAHVGK